MEDLEPFILDLLARSGRLLVERQQTAISTNKSARDLVTDADLASQELIVGAVRSRFPAHAIYSEESERTPKHLFAPDCWVIDPLDGTNNYAYGFPIWGVSIAYAQAGEVVAGGVAYPMQGICLLAEKGKGARQYEADPRTGMLGKPKKLRVSSRAAMSQSMVLVCAHLGSEQADENLAGLGRIAKSVFNVRNLGAAVFNIGYVASGLADACVEFKLQPYDGAAGALLVREAGGKVTDMEGKEWRLDSPTMVCSNGRIHEQLLRSL
ncbi:MAG: inositol monophosphatase [Candidatus Micrarchaeota archaeon]|nr:inositol monophosphatase [Candidatus Micrarchaeota archaeon]